MGSPFSIEPSIKKTIRDSYIVIISFMLLPALLSLGMAAYNTVSYDRLIINVNRTNSLNQVVKTEIAAELWDIVAGNKSFAAGRQYAIINAINAEIEGIRKNAGAENRRVLEVAGRAMDTLQRYVDRLGTQMEADFPVVENERILDEIRGVAALVSDTLQEFTVLEIESAGRANERIKRRSFFLGAAEIAALALVTLFAVRVQTSVSAGVDRSINALTFLSSRISGGDWAARADMSRVREFDALTENLNRMAGKIKDLIETNIAEQKNLQKSEMKALQAQITPHFLYNTLDSIIWLAESGRKEEVVSITRALSAFFRLSLNRGNEWLTVDDEFKHVESYLVIQKIRYRDILDYAIEYDPDMGSAVILKLLLQPLVENALYHGIKNKRGRGMITVKGLREGDTLVFIVADNGAGIPEERLAEIRRQLAGEETPASAAGYGLYNVSRRLELYYNLSGLLAIESVHGEGSAVTLRIPAGAP